jgi:hypothetical protein
MSLVGFEPTISAPKRPQTYALDRAATGIGLRFVILIKFDTIIFVLYNKLELTGGFFMYRKTAVILQFMLCSFPMVKARFVLSLEQSMHRPRG